MMIKNVNEAMAVILYENLRNFAEISKITGLSKQKIVSLNITEWLDNSPDEYVKMINKNYLLTRTGRLFSFLTNTWITPTDNCLRMHVKGKRIKKSVNQLVLKHFPKN